MPLFAPVLKTSIEKTSHASEPDAHARTSSAQRPVTGFQSCPSTCLAPARPGTLRRGFRFVSLAVAGTACSWLIGPPEQGSAFLFGPYYYSAASFELVPIAALGGRIGASPLA